MGSLTSGQRKMGLGRAWIILAPSLSHEKQQGGNAEV